jgi:hypothetical protein
MRSVMVFHYFVTFSVNVANDEVCEVICEVDEETYEQLKGICSNAIKH